MQTIATGEKYGMRSRRSQRLRSREQGARDIKRDGTYRGIYSKWFQADPAGAILKPQQRLDLRHRPVEYG